MCPDSADPSANQSSSVLQGVKKCQDFENLTSAIPCEEGVVAFPLAFFG
jgi:hypothetical protein